MNPTTGTFISMDTYQGSIFEPASLHKYLYANANPVTYCDPSGYMSVENSLDFYQQPWLTVEQASEYETKLICNMHNEVSYDFQVMQIGREIIHNLKNTGLEYALTYVLEPYVGPNVARLIANGAVSALDMANSSKNKIVDQNIKIADCSDTSFVEQLKQMVHNGSKVNERTILYDIDDNIRIRFGNDVGSNAHPVSKAGYREPVPHINIEIMEKKSDGKYKIKYNLHIFLDESGKIVGRFDD